MQARAQFRVDQRFSTFGGEDKMNEQLVPGASHGKGDISSR